MRQITIAANDSGQRLDKFLTKRFKDMPKALMYKYIRTKYIKLNGKRCDIADRLCEGDVLTLYIKDEFFESKPDDYDFLKAPVRLDIIYEDNNIMLLNKKPGLLVHPDENYHFDSLIARVQHYLYDKGEYDPKDENSFAPALVNRIDRNTGGIVIAAKNAEALRILNQKVKDREIDKFYLCIAVGTLKNKAGLLTGFLGKNENKNKVFISDKPAEGLKSIKTGRPLLGDGKYGKNEINRKYGFKYQALYSYRLVFSFKTDGGILSYLNGRSFTAPDVWFTEMFGNFHISDI